MSEPLWDRGKYEALMAEKGSMSDLSAARELLRQGAVSKEGKAQATIRWLRAEIGRYARGKDSSGLPRYPISAEVDDDGAQIRKQMDFLTKEDIQHNIKLRIQNARSSLEEALPFALLYKERFGKCDALAEIERMLGVDHQGSSHTQKVEVG